jgi:hypothetical protein
MSGIAYFDFANCAYDMLMETLQLLNYCLPYVFRKPGCVWLNSGPEYLILCEINI